MISRDEIDAMGAELGVTAANVQRNYIFGWLLAGLYGDSPFGERLTLKGGNAFRKGYFGATRFSDDLDFTAADRLDPQQLLDALNEVCRLVQARTGVQFDIDRNQQLRAQSIDSKKTVYKYKLYFTDFHGKRNNVAIGLRMDVTEFGRLYLPAQTRNLIHPYSDRAECATGIQVVSLEEGLADKLKCLLQRRSSFDLFDLVYSIFVNKDVEVDRLAIVRTFLRKTIFAASPRAALNLLLAVPFDVMRFYWDSKIVCDRRSRLDFNEAVERFKGELGSMFSSFRSGGLGQLAFFPAEMRTPIMDAGSSRTLLRITYHGAERLVEPYSLAFKCRKDGVAREYLYVWDCSGGRSGPGIKAMVNENVTALEKTDIVFTPRYDIELAKAGEFADRTTFGSRAGVAVRRPSTRTGSRSATPRYQVKCGYCNRVFPRSTTSTAMKPHHDPFGNPCYGRRGYRV